MHISDVKCDGGFEFQSFQSGINTNLNFWSCETTQTSCSLITRDRFIVESFDASEAVKEISISPLSTVFEDTWGLSL